MNSQAAWEKLNQANTKFTAASAFFASAFADYNAVMQEVSVALEADGPGQASQGTLEV